MRLKGAEKRYTRNEQAEVGAGSDFYNGKCQSIRDHFGLYCIVE